MYQEMGIFVPKDLKNFQLQEGFASWPHQGSPQLSGFFISPQSHMCVTLYVKRQWAELKV